MVGLMVRDALCPVDLLEQDDAHQLVRKGHPGEGDPGTGFVQDFLG